MSLTVATFNLRSREFTQSGEDTGDRAWSVRIAEAADYIIRSGASLVALQEVDFFPAPRQSQELAAKLFDLTGRTWQRLEDTARPGSFIYDTSEVSFLAGGGATHTEQVDPGYTGLRYATWARFSANGLDDPFWAIRTHFPVTSSTTAEQRPAMYQQAADIVANRADALRSDGSRVVILGDLNHEALPQAALTARGYSDVRTMASAGNLSFRSFNAWDPALVGRQDGSWIDAIFLSKGWAVTSAGLVAKFAAGSSLPLATPLPSDHMPIAAMLTETPVDPGPDPVPLSRDPEPRLICGELISGNFVRDLTPLISACSWSVGLNAAGQIEATIPMSGMPKWERRDLKAALAEGRSYLAVTAGDQIIEAGPIGPRQPAAYGSARIMASGLRRVFEWRTVLSAAVVHDVIDGVIDDGTSVQRSVLTYSGLSLATIAKRLVQNTIAMPGGQLPIQFLPDEVGAETRTYDGFKLPNLEVELAELSNASGGPDIELRPRWKADGSGIEWEMLTGTASDPLLHQDGPDWVLDFTTTQGSVADLDESIDASMRTNFAWTTGAGQDTAIRVSPRTNNADWESGYPLRESVDSYPQVPTWAELHRLGEARIRQGSRPTTTWTATLRPDHPALGQFRPGDWCRLHIADDLWIPDGEYRVRIAGFAGSLATDLVTVTFLPTLEAR